MLRLDSAYTVYRISSPSPCLSPALNLCLHNIQYAYFCFFVTTLHFTSFTWRGDGLQKFPADARQLRTHSLAANERMLSRVLYWQSLQATRAGDILPNVRGKKWGSSMCLTHLLFISFQFPRKRTWANFSTSASKRSKDSSCFHRTIGNSWAEDARCSFPVLPAPFFYCSLSMLKRNWETCHAKCALLTPRRVRQLKRPCLEHMLIEDYWRPYSPSFPLCHSKTKSCLCTRRFCAGQDSSCMGCTSGWPWVAQVDFQPCWNQGIEAMGIMRLAQSYAASISGIRLGF